MHFYTLRTSRCCKLWLLILFRSSIPLLSGAWSKWYLSLTELPCLFLVVSLVATVISRILQQVVLSGLTSLSVKKHPSMACSHRDVALWFLLSSQLPFASSVHVMSLWRLMVLSSTFLLCLSLNPQSLWRLMFIPQSLNPLLC